MPEAILRDIADVDAVAVESQRGRGASHEWPVRPQEGDEPVNTLVCVGHTQGGRVVCDRADSGNAQATLPGPTAN